MNALRLGSLCSGYGGLDLAVSQVLRAEPVWHAETDPGASAILARHWPDVPNLGDITAVDFRAVEPVDVLTAGFPCQDVSSAGLRRGIAPGTRSGLWSHVARAAAALRPSLLVIENVRGLLNAPAHSHVEPCAWCLGDADAKPPLRALGAVLGDLADIGFDAEWAGLPASAVLAPHQRWREFALAWPAAALAASEGREGLRPEPARDRSERGGAAVALAADLGPQRCREPRNGRGGPTHGRRPSADPDGGGRGTDQRDVRAGQPHVAWGDYGPAISRWERELGRPAPAPTDQKGRLAPQFVEWLMGLPMGWVAGTPGLSRSAQLRALGNGVVPRQATAALRILLDRVPAEILPGAVVEGRAA